MKMKSSKMALVLGILMVVALLSGLALGAGLGEVYPPVPQYVEIKNNTTNPSTIAVPLNTTVVWTNHNNATETVTATDGSFDSENISKSGYEYRYIFLKPGRYEYYSKFHPSIKGSVIVGNASSEMTQTGAAPSKNTSVNATKNVAEGGTPSNMTSTNNTSSTNNISRSS